MKIKKINENFNACPSASEIAKKLGKSNYSLSDLIDAINAAAESDYENDTLGLPPNWGSKDEILDGDLLVDLCDGADDPLVWIVDLITSVYKDEIYGC